MSARIVLAVELADLGEWSPCELRSEYDPEESTIRLNRRAIARLAPERRLGFVLRCIAHELYHALEHHGRIKRIRANARREAAADAFAQRVAGAL